MTIPQSITEWLELNQHCAHDKLINSLLDANNEAQKSVAWVKHYFGEDFNPEVSKINLDIKTYQRYLKNALKNTPSKPKLEMSSENTSRAPEVFTPSADFNFGSYFPNALVSRDLGLHKITAYCQSPRLLHVLNVLTDAECDELIAQSRPNLKRSTVVSDDKNVLDSRTSYGTHFSKKSTELVRRIEMRLANLFGYPEENGEAIQVLNYAKGAQYKPHFDYFDEAKESGRNSIGKAGNRVATIIMYLNEPELGGATGFPKANLQILPIKGSVVYFDYFSNDGELDKMSLHSGTPVLEGEKWIATKWIRQMPWG